MEPLLRALNSLVIITVVCDEVCPLSSFCALYVCYVQVYTLLQHHLEFQNVTTSLRLVSPLAPNHLCVMFEFLQLPLRYQLEASLHLVPVHRHSVSPTVKQNCVHHHELVFFDYVIPPALQNSSKLLPTSTASSLILHQGKLLNKAVNSI